MVTVARRRARVAALAATAAATIAAATVAGAVRDSHRRPAAKRPPGTRPQAAATVLPTRGRIQIAALPASDERGGRRVWIYRPGVPDSSDLPVVYFLHGYPGSYRDLATLGVQRTLDQLITRGKLPPFVLAVPDGNSTNASDPEWADSASHSLSLEDFVIGPVRRLVEGDHPRNRAHRAIMGFSMGGYGAMNIALHHPEIYGSVAALAGYFDTDDESGVFGHDAKLLARNSPDHNVDAARRLRIMLADGLADNLSVTKGETQRFASLLRAKGVDPVVDIRPGAHNAAYLQGELPRAFAFLLEGHT